MKDVIVDRCFAVGKRVGARRSPDHRAGNLNAFRKIAAVPPRTLFPSAHAVECGFVFQDI